MATKSSAQVYHFSLGPVQRFIGQARRLRDLWAGSFLLSWLTAEAMCAVLRQDGTRMLAPAVSRDDLEKGQASDAMLRAVWHRRGTGRPADSGPQIGSLVNTFQAEVGIDDHPFDPVLPAQQVQRAWAALAFQVSRSLIEPARELLLDPDTGMAPAHVADSEALWAQQIGEPDGPAPFWETAWVIERTGAAAGLAEPTDGDCLMVRKLWRDRGPPPEARAHDRCMMIPDWPEMSGCVRSRGGEEARLQDLFWIAIAGTAASRTAVGQRRQDTAAAWPTLELRQDERLCAIALVKRLFPILDDDDLGAAIGWRPGKAQGDTNTTEATLRRWPSLAHIAAVRWQLRAWTQNSLACQTFVEDVKPVTHVMHHRSEGPAARGIAGVQALLQRDRDAAPFLELDSTLLYERGVLRAQPGEEADADSQAVARRQGLGNLLSTLRQPAEEADVSTRHRAAMIGRGPSRFYALLAMDGDRLGQHLAHSPAVRAALSKALLHFAATVPEVISAHDGVTLFAGGDDVWAVLPADSAIDAALALREAFQQAVVANWHGVPDIAADDAGRIVTVSCGLVFADYQQPLSDARAEARWALDVSAKAQNRRDSVAVSVLRASGRSLHWVNSWAPSFLDFLPLLELKNLAYEFRALSEDGDYASRWLFKVEQQFGSFLDPGTMREGSIARPRNLRLGELAAMLLSVYERPRAREREATPSVGERLVERLIAASLTVVGPGFALPKRSAAASPPPEKRLTANQLLASFGRWVFGRRGRHDAYELLDVTDQPALSKSARHKGRATKATAAHRVSHLSLSAWRLVRFLMLEALDPDVALPRPSQAADD